jgi:hypothetical protein
VEHEASEINEITAILRGKFIHLYIYTILRKDIEMKPRNTAFHANRTRKKMSIVPDARTSFLRCQSLHGEISSLAENMT